MTTSANDQALDLVAQLMALQGVSLEDLTRHLEESQPGASGGQSRYPTVADLVTTVETNLTENTLRTWHTHFKRLVNGMQPQCVCLCERCLDVTGGCSCGCKKCQTGRITIPAYGDRVLAKRAFTKSELDSFVSAARRASQKKAVMNNVGRAKRGLSPKAETGKGGAENAITALRRLFKELVDDELWDKNPASALDKPARNKSKRRPLKDSEIGPYFDAVASGGDDPDLDVLLCWFHLESGARQAGALSLQVGRIKPATQVVELYEKGEKVGDQPVSAELIAALLWIAKSRGGPACDPRSPQYDPSRPVFYYLHSGRSRRDGSGSPEPAPLTGRRYDTMAMRVQRTLPWANEVSVTVHFLRHTGASIVERIAGTQTARLFLRHADRTVTDTYTHSDDVRLAKAVETMTGARHPMAEDDGPS